MGEHGTRLVVPHDGDGARLRRGPGPARAARRAGRPRVHRERGARGRPPGRHDLDRRQLDRGGSAAGGGRRGRQVREPIRRRNALHRRSGPRSGGDDRSLGGVWCPDRGSPGSALLLQRPQSHARRFRGVGRCRGARGPPLRPASAAPCGRPDPRHRPPRLRRCGGRGPDGHRRPVRPPLRHGDHLRPPRRRSGRTPGGCLGRRLHPGVVRHARRRERGPLGPALRPAPHPSAGPHRGRPRRRRAAPRGQRVRCRSARRGGSSCSTRRRPATCRSLWSTRCCPATPGCPTPSPLVLAASPTPEASGWPPVHVFSARVSQLAGSHVSRRILRVAKRQAPSWTLR